MNIKKLEVEQVKEIANLIWNVMIDNGQLPKKTAVLPQCYMMLYDMIEKGIKDNSLLCYGTMKENELIGMIGYEFDKNEITYLYVCSEYQNQGIGSKLLDAVVESMQEQQTINVRAHRDSVTMYEKYGFKKNGNDTRGSIGMTLYIEEKIICTKKRNL